MGISLQRTDIKRVHSPVIILQKTIYQKEKYLGMAKQKKNTEHILIQCIIP